MKKIFVFSIIFTLNTLVYNQNIVTVKPAFESLKNFPNLRDFTLSSVGDEGYFTIQSPLGEASVLAKLKKINNEWSDPIIVPFSGKYKDIEPFLSPNNLRLYFASNRPLDESLNETKDFDIWYVERQSKDSEWGIPINIGAPINTTFNEFYPSITNDNNLYYTSDGTDSKGKDDIFVSKWDQDQYSSPLSLSDSINTSGYEFNAFISPDESFVVFSGYQREDGLGSGDLYISTLDDNHQWGKAINMGENINSQYMDYCPFYDIKSKTLYFTSRRSSIKNINNFKNIKDLLGEIDQHENGLSRIYKISIDIETITSNK